METGLILGRYRPLAELGGGGHGAVDLAFDTKMARRVAIKRIPLSRTGVRLLSTTVGLKEARTAALLNHPNIVTVHEWDTDDDEAFLIMEHVDGASLAELLDAFAPLDADEAAAVLAPIASAMTFAHENGVLHLDLKPENVLVTRDGLVKVTDFGVASLTNAAGQAISAGGTLGYMPPEQLRGSAVDARTDVWAFAALAFEVLTGAVPFASESIEGALFKAEQTGVPAPGEFEPSLPTAIDDILLDALSPDPDERPGGVARLADGLLDLLGDEARGRDGLRELVARLVEEDGEEPEPTLVELGLWDRLARRSGLVERISVAVASGYLAWAGLEPLHLAWPGSLGACAIAAAAGFFAPLLGLGAGSVLVAIGGFVISPVAGIALTVAGFAWWIAVSRPRPAAGALPAFAPLAAVLHMGPATPLLAGFFLDGALWAGLAGAASGLVLAIIDVTRVDPLAALVHPLATLAGSAASFAPTPSALVRAGAIVVAWAVAAVTTSVGARRGTRAGAAVGMAFALLAIAAAFGPWLTGGSQPELGALLELGAASILGAVVVVLGPPLPAGDASGPEE